MAPLGKRGDGGVACLTRWRGPVLLLAR
jgi:hypothetical protein